MRVPVKITPDLVKDSIVEVRISTDEHPLVTLSKFHSSFVEHLGYDFLPSASLPRQSLQFSLSDQKELLVNPYGDAELTFVKEGVRVKVTPQRIVFNCVGEYLGWQHYSGLLFDDLRGLSVPLESCRFERIGVRYINLYTEEDFRKALKYHWGIGLDGVQFITSNMRLEFDFNRFRVILNLHTRQGKQLDSVSSISNRQGVFDVDIIEERAFVDVDDVVRSIESAHSAEKEVFFSMHNPDFVATLKPEY